MQEVLERNISVLQRKYPHVYTIVEKYLPSADCGRIMHIETRNGFLNFKLKGERSIFLHSNYDPQKEAAALIGGCELKKVDSVVMLGFGLGYHVENLVKSYPDKNKIIIEPDPSIFAETIKNIDITKILEARNLQLLVFNHWEIVGRELAGLFNLGIISSVEFIALPSYNQLFGEFWSRIKDEFIKNLRIHNVNVKTSLASIGLWMENFFINLNSVPLGADMADLENKFDSVPAIIVSAGPSLHKNISLLHHIQDKALIVAAGSTVNAMEKAGVKPHIMVGIDGLPITGEVYSKLGWDDVYFAHTMRINHRALTSYSGPKVYMQTVGEGQTEVLEDFLGHPTPPVKGGGSCAHVAMNFVKVLGCNPVIFIGQDLAYTNMQTHADGRLESKTIENPEKELVKYIKRKDIYGNDTYTDRVFLTMADTFENLVKMHPKDHIFINATEGGISFEGAQNMSLREAIELYCKENKGLKENLGAAYFAGKQTNMKYEKRINEFKAKLERDRQKTVKICEERTHMLKKIISNLKDKKVPPKEKQRKRLFDLTKKVEKEEMFKMFINPLCYDVFLSYKNSSEAQAREREDNIEKMAVLYSGLLRQYEVVDSVLEIMGKAIEKSFNYQENGEEANG